MMRTSRLAWSAVLVYLAFALAPVALAQTGAATKQAASAQDKKAQSKKQKEEKERQRREAARKDEERFAYQGWLEEVSVIITEEELDAFKKLSTNEERESYIEGFWRLRDPSPDTEENEFRDEHYRRIAYANERFSSGIPGWRTDRGRIYILWGPPSEIESHPAGGPYTRPSWEGGGRTTVHPFEQWRYRHMTDVGQDVILEFVDTTGSGEFRLTMDPSEKDALKHVPGAGPSESELLGISTRADRFTNTNGTNLPAPLGATPAWLNPFERLRQYVAVQRPPRFKDLEQVVHSRIVADQIQFSHRFDFLRITDSSVLVPITVQIPNREMHFVERQGVHSATLHLYARISSLTGRTVQVFEDVIQRDVPDSLLRAQLAGQSIHQRAVPLPPGLYRLNIVIKDVASGDIGTLSERLPVPRFEQDRLASSTLILADRIEPVPAGDLGLGPFVIGASKVRPRLGQPFTSAEYVGLFLQVYNLTLDPQAHKASAAIRYRVTRNGAPPNAPPVLEHSATNADLGQHGAQLTIEKLIALRNFQPGDYSVEVVVTDRLTGSSIRQTGAFRVQ